MRQRNQRHPPVHGTPLGKAPACRARVCDHDGSGVAGTGRLSNISMSGAFLETARLAVVLTGRRPVLHDDGAQHVVEFTATVVRTERVAWGSNGVRPPAAPFAGCWLRRRVRPSCDH
jgi:hypothetical protein